MKSRSIQRENWSPFAHQFTLAHKGWTASLEVREPGSPVHIEVDDNAFRGLTVQTREGHDALVLEFGYEPEERIAHVVRDPRALATAMTDDGASASLVVDSADRGRCVLALSNPTREEDFAGA